MRAPARPGSSYGSMMQTAKLPGDQSPLRLGIVGTGFIGQFHAGNAVASARSSSPLDAVLVMTSGSHAPTAIGAAQAGLHVMVEKPMCLNLDERPGDARRRQCRRRAADGWDDEAV